MANEYLHERDSKLKFFSEFGSVYKMDYSQWDNNIEWTFEGLYEEAETGEQFEIWESEGRYRWEEMDDEYYEDDEDDLYCPSSTAGDYSPSCPWKAPGMSISDFI